MASDSKPTRQRAPAKSLPKKSRAKVAPGTKGGRPRIPFDGTDHDKVRLLARAGTRQDLIAVMLGCSQDTLQRRFREELDEGLEHANALVGATLLSKALGGDSTSIIWWEKTRAGMKEIVRNELTGADGKPIATEATVKLDALPLDDLRQLETILGKLGSTSDAPTFPPA